MPLNVFLVTMKSNLQKRLPNQSGIAIGPILFVIAILGILAAAIAAGSGSFTAGTKTESNRSMAAALLDSSQSLKVGLDRITGTYGIAINAVTFASTNLSTDLYAPSAGGITPPSVIFASNPASDVWIYPIASMSGIGTSAGDLLAAIKITQGVCQEINNRVGGYLLIPSAAFGDLTTGSWATPLATFTGSALVNGSLNLAGKMSGCVYNTTASGTASGINGYFFYQVLATQ